MTRIAAIVLAAGASTRFRAADDHVPTKLVAELDGVPLVRRVVVAALASRARPVIVVTGHAGTEVRTALVGLEVLFVHNADFAAGLAGSLRAGLNTVPADAAGALVLLGDMPLVGADLLDRLIESHDPTGGIEAVVPIHGGRRGNPVLLGRTLFDAALRLTGDEGARRLLARARVREIDIDDEAVSVDIDEPATLDAVRRR